MKEPIPSTWEGLPVVGAASMRALDAAATAQHGIPALELMEKAGRAVAAECAAFLGARGIDSAKAKVVVCCGRGANGGDGLVAGRVLREGGASVTAFLCPPKTGAPYPELVRANLERAKAAGVDVREAGAEAGLAEALAAADLALDALLGTGATGKPAGAIHHMIRELTKAKKPVVAIDIPSGLHPDTGYHSGVFVTAELTLALGLAKKGLLAAHAKPQVGTLKVLDVGYPAALLKAAR
ncbi:MAG: NAD(P)H-hydrate epimerase [Elusimicrobiota bacterium]|nr:MAG: NAD(P)H-hydrate epimerase [Elusimicrobiota bacterium]